jgi:hypothetical protein
MDSLPLGIDLHKVPLALNPNGNPPNFVDPSSLDTVVLAVGITLITLSGCLLILRLFANFKHTGKFGLDDGEQSLPIDLHATCLADHYSSLHLWGTCRYCVLGGNLQP